MPKVPIDYSNTIIYKLVHIDDLNDENIYVGHTTNMIKRKNKHKSSCGNPNDKEHNEYKYQFIRENGGWDQWEMILIEKYPCDNGDQARARERYWKRELNATLNTQEPGRTQKEWREDNKEIILEKKKEYYENNKDKIAEKDKERHKKNKQVRNEQSKKWRENNLDKALENAKLYRQKNKEIINEKKKEKATCECGSIVRKNGMPDHRKSNKHQEWLKNNNLIN